MENTSAPAQMDHYRAYEQAQLDSIISRFFSIESITLGNQQDGMLVRYRGRLRVADTAASYDQLTALLAPYNITPLFRWEDEKHAIILIPGKPKPKPSNPVVNLVMFGLTLASVIFVSGLTGLDQIPEGNPANLVGQVILGGLPFALSFLSILAAHEFGHYLMGRRHGVHVTLPYFIPLPLPPFGTMGAFINMKDPPKNRRHLLDIGLAGPLAGLTVAIPILILGLYLSKLDPLPVLIPPGMGLQLEGNSLLYLFLKFAVFGQLLPSPASYGSLPEWLYWLRYFFTGQPYPLGGVDVLLHPVALAGWAGILITALNLIPAGQFDGGHVMYVLFGRKAALRLLPVILVALAVLGMFWFGWWIWILLIFFLGRAHAEPLDQITELDPVRRRLGIFAIVVFILVFTPVPLNFLT
jgi:membrane-associated protease RseP (regulator of RpoE activity)